jgi:phosphoribosylanthranilate isomerase
VTSLIKICGLSTPDTLEAAIAAGADLVGFVRFPRSPRHVELDLGRDLSEAARGRAVRVLLVVDAEDPELDAAVAAIDPDMIQLHGHETPERVAAIRVRYGVPIMKAIGIADASDLTAIAAYQDVADRILLDAKPPKGAALPGGNGVAFDWRILAAATGAEPGSPDGLDPHTLMLSGGLSPDNVAAAIRITGIRAIDVSSGVETSPGIKDVERIRTFIQAARQAFTDQDPAGTPT